MDDLRRLVMQMNEEFKEHKNRTEIRFDKHENRMDKQDDRMDRINDIQIKQGEKISNILETLQDIKGDTIWLRRLVTGGVVSGTISAIIGFVVFAIQKLN